MNEKPSPTGTPKRMHAHNLGHRLDALSIALKNLEDDPRTVDATLRLVASVRASSELHGMTALAESARRAEVAPHFDLPARLRELITLMRLEINRQGVSIQTVLIVSTDADMVAALKPALEAHARRVVIATTSQEALQAMTAQDVSSIVIDFVLTGQDGRALIAALRCKPATAAMPIVAIAPKLADGVKDPSLVQEADGYFEKPIKAKEVAEFLVFRLKRSHEWSRESRRDSLTGLLNRAAFCTIYDELMAQRSDTDEPLTLVMLGISHFDSLSLECGPVVRDELIRQISSILSASFRTTDTVARWGVSEFAVILPGEDQFGGTRAIEKVLSVLNRQKATTPAGKSMALTVCAGLTVVTGMATVEEAVERADHFLYAAHYMNTGSTTVYPIVFDTAHAVRRTNRVALCLADSNMTHVIEQFLERDNFEPLTFSTAEAALRDLPGQRVHMVVLDDETPDDGAFRILQALRAQVRYNRVPIVMLVSSEANIVRALELGANDYAIKPFMASGFIMRVRRILRHGAKSNDGDQPLVLVVDHEVPQLLVAGTALHQQGGCRILLAKGARDGLRRLTDALPDVLVLDMHMPDFSGSDFIKMIPLLPKLRKLEIIPAADSPLTTAKLTSDVFRIRGRVTRPFKPGTFLEEIRPLIRLPPPGSVSEPVDPEPMEMEIQRILTLHT